MDRSIDDGEVLLTLDDFWVDGNAMNHVEINLVDFFTNDGYELVVAIELDVLVVHLVYFVDDAFVVRSQHLCTIIPVSLVAVVLTRVVAGSDIHTTLATEMTDGKAHFRSWTKVVEEINVNTVCRENLSNSLSEKAGVVTAVMTYNDTNLVTSNEVLVEVVRKSLSCSAYRVDIHAVRTSTHNATESTRTELQSLIEAVDEARLVVCLHHCLSSSLCFCVKNWVSCPLLSNFRTLL